MRRYRLRPEQADEGTLDMLCFLLRTARDMVANSARLMLKEEWEIYIQADGKLYNTKYKLAL